MARKYQLHGAFPSKAGDSAYEVALKNGFVGTEQEWLDSLVGPQGPQGPKGDGAESGGLTTAQINALDALFRAAAYTTDVSDKYAAFRKAFGLDSGDEPDIPDEPDVPVITTYSITNNLTGVINSNSATTINEGDAYTATLTVEDGYVLNNPVIITMGGVDITADVYGDGYVLITNVSGDVVITAVATEPTYLGISNAWNCDTVNLYTDEDTKYSYVNLYKSCVSNLRTETQTECEAVITNITENDISIDVYCGSTKTCSVTATPSLYYYNHTHRTVRAGQSIYIPFSVKAERYAMVSINQDKDTVKVAVIGAMDAHEVVNPITFNDVGVGTTYFYKDGTIDTQLTYKWTGINKIAVEPCEEDTQFRITMVNSKEAISGTTFAIGAALSSNLAEGKKIYYVSSIDSSSLSSQAEYVTFYTVPAGYYPAIWLEKPTALEVYFEKV